MKMKRSRVPVNVTVSWELRELMKTRTDLNWSRIAETAFQHAIANTVKRDIIKL